MNGHGFAGGPVVIRLCVQGAVPRQHGIDLRPVAHREQDLLTVGA